MDQLQIGTGKIVHCFPNRSDAQTAGIEWSFRIAIVAKVNSNAIRRMQSVRSKEIG
ncbi:hypothetical protein X732_23525 [Mesorhizobium sp. L2C066B000]|nr:hypothetical protein X732_23525 [Mesorhizobium sp. L2C066B000]